jgi:putative transposase
MARETQRFKVEILAWCLMTNHVHLIAVPEGDRALGRAIGEAHKRYSRLRNFEEGVRGYLFQGRFGSCVLDEKHLVTAVRYVENNPVRAGMVKRAWEYSWSSANFHMGGQKTDVLVKDRNLWGLVANWRDFFQEEDLKGEKDLRRATKTGRPWIDRERLAALENKTRRTLRKGKPGRKPQAQDTVK